MNFYSPQSTENPTGWRPWNSRLSFYTPNTFPVPTTGSGRFLLQPGVQGMPTQSGGLGDATTQVMGLTVDPTLLAMGLVALLAAMYLFGGGRPKRKARRLRKRISTAQSQLRGLAA